MFDNQLVKDRFIERLGEKRAKTFIASAIGLIASNPKLAKCDPTSLLNACMKAAALDLIIDQNLGFAYVIPYKDQAQFQIGWRGFVQLALRTNQYKKINVGVVKEGEMKGFDGITGEYEVEWEQDLEKRENLPMIGCIAYVELTSGYSKAFYMTKEELENHARTYSKSYKLSDSKWKTQFEAMAMKTVLKMLLGKYGVLSTEMQEAIRVDQAAIVGDDEEIVYLDNEAISADEVSEAKEKERILKWIEDAKTVKELAEIKVKTEGMDDVDIKEALRDKMQVLA